MTGVFNLYPRSPDETHRSATPLELFVDLCFVVAIAQVAAALHHGISAGHIGHSLVAYPVVFFAIWWAWINFTWFASSYDNDDAIYRIATFGQIAGILVLAAGVEAAFNESDFRVLAVGFVITRLALVWQYLRAARSDPQGRPALYRLAIGVSVLQVLWVYFAFFVSGQWQLAIFIVLAVGEILVPVWAERASKMNWHPHHIAERYGLLTIIVLGESILAAVIAAKAALSAIDSPGPLAWTTAGAVVIVCAMWWLYFDVPTVSVLEGARLGDRSAKQTFLWGYGHFFIFTAAAAVGAGVGAIVDVQTDHSEVTLQIATLSVGVPVAIYAFCMWALHRPVFKSSSITVAFAAAIAAILLVSFAALPLIFIGLILIILIAVNSAVERRYTAQLMEATPGAASQYER